MLDTTFTLAEASDLEDPLDAYSAAVVGAVEAVGPAVVSLLVSNFGVHAVPFALAVFAALDVAVFASARRFRPLVVASSVLRA